MRDPKEWAAHTPMAYVNVTSRDAYGKRYDSLAVDRDFLARLIRDAQEDGAREWKNQCIVEVQAVAALTERAEKAEREANEWHKLLAETSSNLDDAEYERDEAVKALDVHKERADRAESELHRRKF